MKFTDQVNQGGRFSLDNSPLLALEKESERCDSAAAFEDQLINFRFFPFADADDFDNF